MECWENNGCMFWILDFYTPQGAGAELGYWVPPYDKKNCRVRNSNEAIN